MLNVSEAVKQRYLSDEFNGDYKLVIGETTYTGRNVQQGSIEIVESLCSGDDFDLSAVEKGEIQFTLINFAENIKDVQGKTLTAYQTVAGEDVPLGVYTVTDAQYSGEYLVDVKAHDNLVLLDRDVTDWWNNTVVFPITHRNLLTALCDYCGIRYNIPESYCNSALSIDKAFDGESVKGLDLLGWLQEISASFYRCNRYGVLTTRTMRYSNLVPRIGLYPRTGLYPFSEQTDSDVDVAQKYTVSHIVADLEIADYTTKHIDKLQISSSDNDIGVIVGDGTNTYRIVANPLLFGVDTATLETVAEAIFKIVRGINYRPFSAKLKGLPYLEVGDTVQLTTLKGIKILEPILKRTMSGSGLAYDTFECVGKEKRETVSAVNKTYKVLNRRFHVFENTVDELSSTVGNVEQRVTTNETNITQNAKEISLTAQRSGVFNLLTNSDFSNQANRTQSWTTSNLATEYVYDELFMGESTDILGIENGNCLKVVPIGSESCSIYQEINYTGTISERFGGEVSYRVINADGATIQPFLQVYSGDTSVLNISVGARFTADGKIHNMRWSVSDADMDRLDGVNVTRIQYGVYVLNATTSVQLEINHLLLTFSESLLPFYAWTNYATKDLISQINLAPTGLRINADKLTVDTSSLDLTFGSAASNVTIKATDENDGVLFDGSGKVHFETNGEFLAKNLDSSNHEANRLLLVNTSEESSAEIYNYWNNVRANDIDLTGNATSSIMWLVNNRPGANINANNHYMGVSSNSYENRLYNYRYGAVSSSGGVINANSLVLQSYKTDTVENNYTTLRNYSDNGTLINNITFRSQWKGSTIANNVWVENRNSSGKDANRLWFDSESGKNNISLSNFRYDVLSASNTSLLANQINLVSDASETRFVIVNEYLRAEDGTDTASYDANYIKAVHNKGTSQNTIEIVNKLLSSATKSSSRYGVEANKITMSAIPLGTNQTKIENFNKYGALANMILTDATNYPYFRFVNYQKDNTQSGSKYIASSIYLKQTDVINSFDFYNNKKSTTTNLEEFSGNHMAMYTWSGNSSAVINLDNKHWNGNTANLLQLASVNNSSFFLLRNYDSDGNVRSALDMNSNGTMQLKTMVNGSSKCMIQASSYGNLDLVTTGALHFNVGSITVQDGSTYRTGAGSGGSPTGTDNVAVKNWDYSSTNNSVINLHFKNGLYIGWSKA